MKLQEIKEMCQDSLESVLGCDECKFNPGGNCLLQAPPCDWRLELIKEPSVQQQGFANQGVYNKNGEKV